MKIAVITGASSGLGLKYADAVIEKYPGLDEIWLIARRKERLESYAAAHSQVTVRPVPLDLTDDDAYGELRNLLTQEKASIRVLVNNAGYEKSSLFEETAEEDIRNMIGVNVKGFTMINRVCLPFMQKESIGIMTCSVSSFCPIPNQAVYSATKAYIRYLSRALHEEMKRRGVKLLMICPGNMDTEMNPKGEGRLSGRINMLPYLDMELITRRSLELAEKGRCSYTPGAFYKFYGTACKLIPEAVMTKIAAQSY